MILSQHLSYTVPESDMLTGKLTRELWEIYNLRTGYQWNQVLGVGAILHSRSTGLIMGLTTAATIWTENAAIGLAVGAGYYILGGISNSFRLILPFMWFV